jgi:hypothetical protein
VRWRQVHQGDVLREQPEVSDATTRGS